MIYDERDKTFKTVMGTAFMDALRKSGDYTPDASKTHESFHESFCDKNENDPKPPSQ